MSLSVPQTTLTVALIGNPNTGKSTLFSALVGIYQRVGNYPGVTVEKKSGRMDYGGRRYDLVDLPGLYSLAPRSLDEMVAVEVLLGRVEGQQPVDAIICVVDASNLRRNLYLVSQVLELGLPTVLALNMLDVAKDRGISLDVERLRRHLPIPVVPIQAHRRIGIDELKVAVSELVGQGFREPVNSLPEPLQHEVARLEAAVADHTGLEGQRGFRSRFIAQRLLLDGNRYWGRLVSARSGKAFRAQVEAARKRVAASGCAGPDTETTARFNWVSRILEGAVIQPGGYRPTATDRIDRILTHRLWGTLVLLLVTIAVFQAVFVGAEPLKKLIDGATETAGRWIVMRMPAGALESLLVKGILGGVGAVLSFLPQIAILFLFIAVLEDCGYIARAAYLMDKMMARVGLSGKSFLPMLSSFACAVPGIMGARVVENERDRLTTILVTPLLPCSARLPIYTLLIAAFIPARSCLGGLLSLQGVTFVALYGLGIVAAVGMAKLLKRTILRGETPLFLMELPSYQWPSARAALHRVVERCVLFLRCAGTLILAVSIVTWAAMYYPGGGRSPQQSILGRVGRFIEPVVRPLGWDWRVGCAVVASFPAREVVVATMGVIFAPENDEALPGSSAAPPLRESLGRATWQQSGHLLFTVPTALSIMVFFTLCAQCVATLAVIRRETNSWRWPAFTFTYMTTLAYVGAMITYQVGTWISLQ